MAKMPLQYKWNINAGRGQVDLIDKYGHRVRMYAWPFGYSVRNQDTGEVHKVQRVALGQSPAEMAERYARSNYEGLKQVAEPVREAS